MSASHQVHAVNYRAPTILTLATGVVTITQRLHIIAAETGTTDDIDTILIGYDSVSMNGYTYWPVLCIRADAGDTVTLKHGTGNLDLPGDADIDVTDDAWVFLIYDVIQTVWQGAKATPFT
jgi:hypothetical protein